MLEEKINQNGKKLLELCSRVETQTHYTRRQIELILSLQNIIYFDETNTAKLIGKKKRGTKLDIQKLQNKFNT